MKKITKRSIPTCSPFFSSVERLHFVQNLNFRRPHTGASAAGISLGRGYRISAVKEINFPIYLEIFAISRGKGFFASRRRKQIQPASLGVLRCWRASIPPVCFIHLFSRFFFPAFFSPRFFVFFRFITPLPSFSLYATGIQ